jgi:hypothetical protein
VFNISLGTNTAGHAGDMYRSSIRRRDLYIKESSAVKDDDDSSLLSVQENELWRKLLGCDESSVYQTGIKQGLNAPSCTPRVVLYIYISCCHLPYAEAHIRTLSRKVGKDLSLCKVELPCSNETFR